MPTAMAISTCTYSFRSGDRRVAIVGLPGVKSATCELRINLLFDSILANFNDHLYRVFDALAGVFDGDRDLCEREGVGVDHLGVEALLRHQRRRAMSGALALTADAEDIDVVTHEIGEVDRHRVRREGGEADPPAAVDHARGLVEGVRRARAFEYVLHSLAMGDPLDRLDRILAVDVDGFVRTEPFAHLEPPLAGAGQDHRLCAQRLSDADTHQSDRTGASDDNRLARNDPTHNVEAVHRGPGGDDQCRLLVAHVVGDMDHRVDVVDRIFGETAVGAEAVGAMPLLAPAVIEARGVHAFAAALAAPASGMHLDGDAVADLEFVDRGAEPHDGAHILMTRREAAVERELAIDYCRQPVLDDLDVGGAHRYGVDPDQHLGAPRLRDRLFDQSQFFRVAEHPGLHRLRDGILVGAVLVHPNSNCVQSVNVRARRPSNPGR